MLQAVARIAQAEGRAVTGLAFQNKMVGDLTEGAGIKSQTVASFILANERHVGNRQGDAYDQARATFSGQMLVVDETSMVSSDDMLKLHRFSAALPLLPGNLPPLADRDGRAPLPKVEDLKPPPDLRPDRGDVLPPLPERSLGLDL